MQKSASYSKKGDFLMFHCSLSINWNHYGFTLWRFLLHYISHNSFIYLHMESLVQKLHNIQRNLCTTIFTAVNSLGFVLLIWVFVSKTTLLPPRQKPIVVCGFVLFGTREHAAVSHQSAQDTDSPFHQRAKIVNQSGMITKHNTKANRWQVTKWLLLNND